MVHLLERFEAFGTVMGAVKRESGHCDGAFSQFCLSVFKAGVSQRRVDGVAVVIESGLYYSRLSEGLLHRLQQLGRDVPVGGCVFPPVDDKLEVVVRESGLGGGKLEVVGMPGASQVVEVTVKGCAGMSRAKSDELDNLFGLEGRGRVGGEGAPVVAD